MNESGFVVLYRSLLNWKYHDVPTAFSLWIHILMRANWKDGYFLGELIPRGSFATSYRRLAEDVGIDPKTLRTYLKQFAEDGMIEVKSGNRFTRIKVLNYSIYQDIREDTIPTVIPTQIPTQIPTPNPTQTPTRIPYNRTKKQSNKETKEQFLYTDGASHPSREQVSEYIRLNNLVVDADEFVDYYEANGWRTGRNPIKDWKAVLRNWHRRKEKELQNKRRLPF